MSQSPLNQMLVLALAGTDPAKKLSDLCLFANRYPDEDWVEWLHVLANDAVKLLDRIEAEKEAEKKAGTAKPKIDEHLRFKREEAKPSRAVRESLADAMDSYPFKTTLSFNPNTCKVMQEDKHPASTSSERRVAFALCLAIRDRHWQSFRHCKEPKCGTLFFDDMKRGRNPQRYCCKNHGAKHQARLRRGNP